MNPLEASDPVYSARRDDPDFVELLPMFIEELPSMKRAMMEFGKVCDFENLKREAHKLRGSAGGYGFHDLSQLAGDLEDSCKESHRDATIILRELDQLIGYIERVRV